MNNKDIIIAEQAKQIDSLTATVAELTATVAALTKTVEELQETIRDLRRQLNQDSHNSSKPPSSDGFKKPHPQSLRKKSGKKPGGQKGHPGSHMEVPHDPDEVKQYLPEKCKMCPHLTECLAAGTVFQCAEKRYEVNAVIQTKVSEHQVMKCNGCPYGERCLTGHFPEQIKAYVQYGDSVSVLVGLLSTYGAVSAERIHVLLGSLLDVRLSTGTISSMIEKCADRVGDTLKAIRKLLIHSGVAHFDETGVDVNGKTIWVHNASTDTLTYQTVSKKRGHIGMEEGDILPDFRGVCVHDCWTPYWKYDAITHAVCNAHLLRELNGVEEYSPEHKWAGEFKNLLLTMKKIKGKAIDQEKQAISYYYRHKFDKEYDRILELADEECPAPPDTAAKKKGKQKKGKERSLIERLRKLKASVCLFIHDFRVPFDNNQAERDVRNVKTKVKVSGCFRTEAGAQHYLDVMSFLSTGRKHGVNAFTALTAAFSGNAEIVLQ